MIRELDGARAVQVTARAKDTVALEIVLTAGSSTMRVPVMLTFEDAREIAAMLTSASDPTPPQLRSTRWYGLRSLADYETGTA